MQKSLIGFFQSKFFRNVILVASGTVGARAITMAFSSIITKLYGPEAFGLLGAFVAVLAIVMPIAALSYPVAMFFNAMQQWLIRKKQFKLVL